MRPHASQFKSKEPVPAALDAMGLFMSLRGKRVFD
jgi:hypothetical protein